MLAGRNRSFRGGLRAVGQNQHYPPGAKWRQQNDLPPYLSRCLPRPYRVFVLPGRGDEVVVVTGGVEVQVRVFTAQNHRVSVWRPTRFKNGLNSFVLETDCTEENKTRRMRGLKSPDAEVI